MKEIPAAVFKAQCLTLMEDVRSTKRRLVITKRGKPVAKLVPIDEPKDDFIGQLGGGSIRGHNRTAARVVAQGAAIPSPAQLGGHVPGVAGHERGQGQGELESVFCGLLEQTEGSVDIDGRS